MEHPRGSVLKRFQTCLLCLALAFVLAALPSPARGQDGWRESTISGNASAQIACARDKYGWLHAVYIRNGVLYHSSGALNEGWLAEQVSGDIDPAKGVKVTFNEDGGPELFFMNAKGDIMIAGMDGGSFNVALYRNAEPGLDLSNMDRSYQFSEGDTGGGNLAALVFWMALINAGQEKAAGEEATKTVVLSRYDPSTLQPVGETQLLPQTATGDSAVVIDRNGFHHLVSGKLRGDGYADLVYLTDKSGAWTEEVIHSQAKTGIGQCDIAVDAGGGIHIAFQAVGAKATTLYYTGPADGGGLTQVSTGGAGVCLDLDKVGGAHLSFLNDQSQVCYWLRTADGQAEQWVVDERQADPQTSVAATAAGGAAVVYSVPDGSGTSTVLVRARGDQD